MVRILSACELCEDLSRPQSLFGMHASLPLTQPAQSRYDMSAYILYQNQTIPEKWGGSLGAILRSRSVPSDADSSAGVCVAKAEARPITESLFPCSELCGLSA